MKLKEVARLWGLYTILTKEMGFGLQGTINGEMPRKYMGELLENKGYFRGCFISGDESLLTNIKEGHTFTKRNLCSIFR